MEHLLQLMSKLPLENIGRWKSANSPTGRGYLEAYITPNPVAIKAGDPHRDGAA